MRSGRTGISTAVLLLSGAALLACILAAIGAQAAAGTSGDQAVVACVCNYDNSSVSLIDTGTDQVLSTIRLGADVRGPTKAAPSPDGKLLYVVARDSDLIAVVDLASGRTVARIAVGAEPSAIAVDPRGNSIYVGHFGSYDIFVIDARNYTVAARIRVPDRMEDLVVSRDGTRLYAALSAGARTLVIDTGTNRIVSGIRSLDTDDEIYCDYIVQDGTGATLYCVNGITPSIMKVDANALQTAASMEGVSAPTDAALTPDGKYLYISGWDNPQISVVETTGMTLYRTINVGGISWYGVDVTPDGKKAYASDTFNDSVTVIDTQANTVLAKVPVEGDPRGITIIAMAGGQGVTPSPSATANASAVLCCPAALLPLIAVGLSYAGSRKR